MSQVVVKKKCEIRKGCRKNKPAIYVLASSRYVSEKSKIQFTMSF